MTCPDARIFKRATLCFLSLLLIHCGPDPLVFDASDLGTESTENNRTNGQTGADMGSGWVDPFTDLGGGGADQGDTPNNGVPSDGCALESVECVTDEQFRTCISNGAGGTQWSQPSYCPYAICVEEIGKCCDVPCPSPGAKQCGNGGVQTCEMVEGCLVWSEPEECPEGGFCTGAGTCQSQCQSQCQPGEQRCVMEGGSAYQKCEDVGGGCYQFAATTFNCGTGSTCGNGSCTQNCNNACSMVGDKRCQGSTEQECVTTSSGCLDWVNTGNPTACGPSCTDRCTTENATRCDANNNDQTCRRQATGCLDWQNDGTSCAPLDPCYSSSLGGIYVDHGTCVQNAPDNTYHTCGNGDFGCLWAFCNNGSWDYQCPQGNQGPCATAAAKHPHNVCN